VSVQRVRINGDGRPEILLGIASVPLSVNFNTIGKKLSKIGEVCQCATSDRAEMKAAEGGATKEALANLISHFTMKLATPIHLYHEHALATITTWP
jgi:hypothetical protein